MSTVHNHETLSSQWLPKSALTVIGSVALVTAVVMAILTIPQISSKIDWKWPISLGVGGACAFVIAGSIYFWREAFEAEKAEKQQYTNIGKKALKNYGIQWCLYEKSKQWLADNPGEPFFKNPLEELFRIFSSAKGKAEQPIFDLFAAQDPSGFSQKIQSCTNENFGRLFRVLQSGAIGNDLRFIDSLFVDLTAVTSQPKAYSLNCYHKQYCSKSLSKGLLLPSQQECQMAGYLTYQELLHNEEARIRFAASVFQHHNRMQGECPPSLVLHINDLPPEGNWFSQDYQRDYGSWYLGHLQNGRWNIEQLGIEVLHMGILARGQHFTAE